MKGLLICLNSSEYRAFSLCVLRSIVSLISDLIVDLEEAELLGIIWIDKLRNLQEVLIVYAKKLIFDACLVNQLSLSRMALENFRQLVASLVVLKVRRDKNQHSRVLNCFRHLTLRNFFIVEVLGSPWSQLSDKHILKVMT